MYSPRPGTPAAEMAEQVSPEVKAERLQRLQALIIRGQRAFNARFAGSSLDVLLEKPGKLPGQLVGRSPYLQAVQVMAPQSLIGRVARVTVTEVGSNSLFGALAQETPAPQLAVIGA
jgi:tRNA-2-methylthio-N6-dimethylallyladenosine synthase